MPFMAISPLGLPFISHVYLPWLCLSITFSGLLVLHTILEAASNPLWNDTGYLHSTGILVV